MNKNISEEIIKYMGGSSNIISIGNCMTRVRVEIKEKEQCNILKLKEITDVLGVVCEGNSVQVVVGPGKSRKIAEEMKMKLNKQKFSSDHKQVKSVKIFLKKIAQIFIPIIPAFIACGLMVAIYEGACVYNPLFQDSDLGKLISAISYAVFAILPIIVGYNAAFEFNGSPIIGAVLASILTSDVITGVNLFGVKVVAGRGGIISILIVSILGALLENRLRKFIPELLDMFLTPLLTIIIMTSLGLLIFQPLGGLVSDAIGTFVNYIIYNIPALAGVATLLYLPLVVTGMHHGLIAVNAALIADFGVTYLLPVTCMAGAGQVGAAMYVMYKTKNENLKKTCKNSLPVGILGIGEPLMWGVTIPLGKPFLASCIGGAIGGSAVAIMGVAAKIPELSGVQLSLITNSPVKYLVGLLISYAAGFLFCMLLGFEDPSEEMQKIEE